MDLQMKLGISELDHLVTNAWPVHIQCITLATLLPVSVLPVSLRSLSPFSLSLSPVNALDSNFILKHWNSASLDLHYSPIITSPHCKCTYWESRIWRICMISFKRLYWDSQFECPEPGTQQTNPSKSITLSSKRLNPIGSSYKNWTDQKTLAPLPLKPSRLICIATSSSPETRKFGVYLPALASVCQHLPPMLRIL